MTKSASASISTITESTQNLVEITTRKKFLYRKAKQIKLKIVLIVCAILLFIFIVCFIVAQCKYNALLSERLCTTSDCIATAEMFQKTMDPTINPCDDFFAYACGRFQHNFPIPDTKLSNSWFEISDERLLYMIREVLEKPEICPIIKPSMYARDYYKSCKNTTEIQRRGLTPLYDTLKMIGLPKYPTSDLAARVDLGAVLGMIQKLLGLDIFISLGIAKGSLREGEPNDTLILELMPYFDEPDIHGVRSEVQKFTNLLSPQQAALQRISLISNVIGLVVGDLKLAGELDEEFNSSKLAAEAFKIIGFSSQLISIDNKSESATTATSNLSTFQTQMEEHMNEDSVKLNFIDYVKILFNGTGVDYDADSETISIVNLEKFKILVGFITSAKPRAIVRYVWWWVVEKLAPLTTAEMKKCFDEYRKSITDLDPISREKHCLMETQKHLGLALSYDFAKTLKFAENTEKVEEMLNDIVTEFEHIIFSLSWMDYETKMLSVRKVRAIKTYIGFEKETINATEVELFHQDLDLIYEDEYLINMIKLYKWKVLRILKLFKSNSTIGNPGNPLNVNAFYSRTDNAIFIPPGILQRPFYYRGLESLNYGAIGTILGHELTHGFDNEGKNYDEHGQQQEKLWSDNMTEQYFQRADCFVKQYETFNISSTIRLNGTFTLAENIADNGGLRESVLAYQSYRKRHGSELKLPGFEKFSHEQLLFLSYANIWCDVATETFQKLSVLDPHSPNRVRVLATLQNTKEFSDAFNCPEKSFMNPKEKCVLW